MTVSDHIANDGHDSTIADMSAQIIDLSDEINEITETVHNQWVTFCDDNEDIEVRLMTKYKKLVVACSINSCMIGVLICLIMIVLLN